MNEDEVKAWIEARWGVSRGTKLAQFVDIVRDEAPRQNLIAASTLDDIWHRHILDSAQLVPLAGEQTGKWLDIGSGAGFPGMVAALLTDRMMVLVEPRRRRAEFLRRAASHLDIERQVEVLTARIERLDRKAAIISARAVAALPELFDRAAGSATPMTRWLLPKGRGALAEVELARRTWHGRFQLQPSITDEESRIVIADQVSRR